MPTPRSAAAAEFFLIFSHIGGGAHESLGTSAAAAGNIQPFSGLRRRRFKIATHVLKIFYFREILEGKIEKMLIGSLC
jgi:hypothetical protein